MLDGGADAAYRAMVGRGGGTWRHRIEVWWSGERVDTYGDDGVPVNSGSVAVNLGNRVTRNLAAEVPAELYPFGDADLLSPFGAQLRVYAGWQFGSIPVFWFPVFVGPVTSAGPITTRSATFELVATDLAEGVVADRFLTARSPRIGELATSEFQQLIANTYPGVVFGRFDEQYTVVPDVTWSSDRAGACDTLATASSCMWFFDAAGSPTWRRVPWTYRSFDSADVALDGDTGLRRLSVRRSSDGVYNVVVVSGKSLGSDAPVSAYAMDMDEVSPTYVNGPMGSRVMEVSSDVATVAQAGALARQTLARSRAVSRSVQAVTVADPSLELCDVADLSLDGWLIRAALTSFTVPLTGGAPTMVCTFREAEGSSAE